jgi:galactokinase
MEELDLFVPGRLCLFGEHSDWAGGYRRENLELEKGYCLIVGTDQGIYAKVSQNQSHLHMTSVLPNGDIRGPIEYPMQEDALLAAAKQGGFFSYSAGVAYYMLKNYGVSGIFIHSYKMNLPVRKGLSSSAAVNVLTARAFNKIYHLDLSRQHEMEIAYQGEIITPSQCGRMDQGCAFGGIPILMTFDGDNVVIDEVHPRHPIYMLIVDLHAAKDTTRILKDLNDCYHHRTDSIALKAREYLGLINKTILHDAVSIIRDSDAQSVGALMTRAQSLFDECLIPACPSELSAPKLHAILKNPKIQPLIWGGKGVGSQGDGCAQFVCRGPEERESVKKILTELDTDCIDLTIRPQG